MEKLEIEIGADVSPLKRDLGKARDDIKGFKERAKTDTAIELSLKIAKLKADLQSVKQLMKTDLPNSVVVSLSARSEVLRREVTQAGRELTNFLRTGEKDVSVLGKLFSSVGWSVKDSFSAIGPAIAGAFAVGSIKSFSDEFTNMRNSLKQIASGSELDALQSRIVKLANESRVPVAALADSFVRYDKVIKAMGWNQEQTFVIMDSLSKSLISTGRSASETSSIMLQLSQAFASGKLQGDEFRSLSENLPQIMDILAKSMNVPRGQLKELASDGKITATVLRDALIQANAEINDQFNKSSVTIGQALTKVRNSLLVAFGNFDEATGFTEKIVEIIGSVEGLIKFFGTVEGKTVAFGAAIAALTGLFSLLIPVLGGATVAFSAAAASGGVLAGVLALIGGPITLISVGLGLLGAGAFYAYESFNGLTGATGELQSQLDTLQEQQEKNTKAFENGSVSQEEYTRKTNENRAAQEQLKNAIDEVKNGTLTYETVKNRINGLKKIADVDAYNRETSAINAQISALKELLSIKATQSKAALASFKQAKAAETPMTGPGSLMGNETTQAQIEASAKAFQEYEKQNAEYKKLQNEVAITEKAFADAQKAHAENQRKLLLEWSGAGGGGGGGGGKKKSAESIAKDELERQKKLLEEKAANEIRAVNASVLSETKKAKRIIEISEKLKTDLKLLEGKYTDVQVDNAKKVLDDAEKQTEKLKKTREEAYKDLTDSERKNIEDVKRLGQEYGNLKNKLAEVGERGAEEIGRISTEIDALKTKLGDIAGTKGTDLGQRLVEVTKELKESRDSLNVNGWISGEELEERRKTIAALEAEKVLIEANTTAEQRREGERLAGRSKAQEIIEAYEADKKKLEQDIAAAETRKKIKQEEIDKDVADIKTKMDAIAIQITTETQLMLAEDVKRRKMESDYTAFFGVQMAARKDMLQQLIEKAREAQIALQAAGVSTMSGSAAAGNTTANSTVMNITNNQNVDAESFLRALNTKIPTK